MCLRQNKISEEGENTRHPPLFGAEDFYIRDLVSLLFEYLYLAEVHSLTRQATCVSYPDILCRYGKSHSSHLFFLKVVIFTRISSGSLSRKSHRGCATVHTPFPEILYFSQISSSALVFSPFSSKFSPISSCPSHRLVPGPVLFLSLPSRRRC